MAERAFHTIGPQPCPNCASPQQGYFNDGSINTNINFYKGTTSRSCVFPTYVRAQQHYNIVPPGSPQIAVVRSGGASPTAGNFYTNPQHPAKNSLFVNPADFAVADVYLSTSFQTTTLDGQTIEHLTSQTIMGVTQPNQSTTLPNNVIDTPLKTLQGFMLGSFDQVLMSSFSQSPYPFNVLVNPNEQLYGTPELVQIVWPSGIDWTLSFIAPSNDSGNPASLYAVQYIYSSNGIVTAQSVDGNGVPFGDAQQMSFMSAGVSCKTFAVYDEPTGYVTCRYPFNLSYPPVPYVCNGVTGGISGTTGLPVASAQMCIFDISVDNYDIPINTSCMCSPFVNEGITGITGLTGYVVSSCPIPVHQTTQQNGQLLVNLLNAAFQRYFMTGWLAVVDTYYPFFRIVHPDNILQYQIKLYKNFYDTFGNRLTCLTQEQWYSQGALTTFVTKDPNTGATVYNTNSDCQFDGFSWCAVTDQYGCFIPTTTLF
jgi:hypothetical protein